MNFKTDSITTYVCLTIDKLKLISRTLVLAYPNENAHRLINGGITESVVSLLRNDSGADSFQFKSVCCHSVSLIVAFGLVWLDLRLIK